MADAHEKTESGGSGGASGGGSGKLMMGLLGLNMVVMIAVAVVLFLGQKKQAQQASLEQVAEGAHAEAAGGEHGAPAAGGGEHGGGGGGEHGGGGKKGEPAVDPNAAKFFALGDFTANLSGPASGRYVKITVNFEMSKDSDEEELKARKPQFRDKVISLLNAKKPDDLQTAEGRNYLKEEIKTVANTFVKKGKVEGVYFSAFVIN